MSSARVNGYDVIAGRILLPLVGAWTADLVIDSRDPITGAVVIETEGLELHGFARPERSAVHLDTVNARIVGGAGGLRTTVSARDYQGVPLRLPLGDLLGAGGEALAAITSSDVLATQLDHWTCAAQPLGHAIASLVAAVPGANWRVLASGEVWLGLETWPTLAFEGELQDDEETEAAAIWQVTAPTLYPGVTITDASGTSKRVGDVEHTLGAVARTKVWYVDGVTRAAGLRGSILGLVRAAFPRIDYLARYDGEVVAQSADGRRVDVRLDDTDRFGDGLGEVPLRLGLPGAKAFVAPGARVLVGWERGDPRLPYAEAWPGDESVTLLRLTATGIEIVGGPNANVTISTTGTGKVVVNATAVTGRVELGPNPIAAPLVQGSLDSMGVPVTQLPAAALSIVRSG